MRSERSSTRLRTFGAIAIGVAILALIFGAFFSSTDATATESDADSSDTSSPQLSGANRPASSSQASAAADTVEVTITSEAIDVPETVSAGATVFEVTNESQAPRGFAIGADRSAPAEAARLGRKLAAGQSKTLTAELEPGTYLAYVPAAGEKAQQSRQKQKLSAEFTVERQSSAK